MATLKEIVDNIYTVVNLNSDDNELDRRSIRYWVRNKRAFLLKRLLNQKQFIPSSYKQSIPCLELELVDSSLSDCCIGLSSGCKVLRSVRKLPRSISQQAKSVLEIRPLISIDSKFSFVDHDAWGYSGNSRFNKSDVYATKIDDYLYVKTNDSSIVNQLGKYLYVTDIFDNPEELANFTNCNNGTLCYTDQMDYPIEEDMVDVITKMILSEELNINLRTEEDKSNDSTQDNSTQLQKG